MARAHDVTVCLIGSEQHKAKPDPSDDSGFWLLAFGFWLRVKADDASPLASAFKASPAAFREFRIEQRVGKQIRTSTLSAQIVKIEEGPAETQVQIRPDPKVEALLG